MSFLSSQKAATLLFDPASVFGRVETGFSGRSIGANFTYPSLLLEGRHKHGMSCSITEMSLKTEYRIRGVKRNLLIRSTMFLEGLLYWDGPNMQH